MFIEFIAGKLPTVPEEQTHDYKPAAQNWLYSDLDLFHSTTPQIPVNYPFKTLNFQILHFCVLLANSAEHSTNFRSIHRATTATAATTTICCFHQ